MRTLFKSIVFGGLAFQLLGLAALADERAAPLPVVESSAPSFSLTGYLGLGDMGGMHPNGGTTAYVDSFGALDYGLRLSKDVWGLGAFGKMAIGVSFDRMGGTTYTGGTSLFVNTLTLQFIFREIGGSGFYFGPEFGMGLFTDSPSSFDTTSSGSSDSGLADGALVGYEFRLSDRFLLGPEMRLTEYAQTSHLTNFTNETRLLLRVLACGTFRF